MEVRSRINIPCLLINKLSLLKTLDISGQDITDQGAVLLTTILPHTASLEVLDISYTLLNAVKCIKITDSLKHISALKCLKMCNNSIGDDAAGYISAAVSSNCLMEELDLSNNQLSSFAMIEILTLQELNLSQNPLMFTGVVRIAQALCDHPNLKCLNIEKSLISFFSECEFLVDVILSTNKSLLYLNVCGRNIRPRFVEDHMTPPCSHEKCNSFVIQNLYLPDLLLSSVLTSVYYPKEAAGEDISSYYVDHNGGTFYNIAHNFAIIIPPGAVLQRDCVQIQATASRFGPYQLPDGYYPISSFFWVSAHYTFKIPVYLILSHYASPRKISDLHKLCALEACTQNVYKTGDGKLIMSKFVGGVFFDGRIGYCVISTDHFCSYCLGKDDIHLPDKFHALYYKYNFEGLLKAEVCMCHANRECIKVYIMLLLIKWYTLYNRRLKHNTVQRMQDEWKHLCSSLALSKA